MACTYIALGANLGSPVLAFKEAMAALNASQCCWVSKASRLYESVAHEACGPDYLNAVCEVMTTLKAPALLELMQSIELSSGRVREFLNQPRPLDMDLLFYGQAQIFSKHLQVPHPRWSQRAFVLLPLQDLVPEWVSEHLLEEVAQQSIRCLGVWVN